jgi:tetraacyldisaccharide-1-P 4'-kinase
MFRGPGVILATINNNQNENKIVFKNRVIREILQVTQNKDAVLISVDDSHWYAAFNRDGRIVFVDSQTGKGLMYIDQPYHHTLFLKIHKFL